MSAMIPSVLARAALIVLAVLAGGWLAVGLYSSELQERAEHPAPGDTVADRLDMLERAELLNPSVELDLRAGQILLVGGDVERAVRTLRDVVRREPDNRFAWAGLVQALRESDPAGARRALRELRRLVPPVEDAES